jgi:hypothetical protein
MQGLSDDEMASLFGIKPELMQKWKSFYPSFKQAIEEGRTQADAAVVVALFKRATGYSHPEEKQFVIEGDLVTHDTIKHYPPDYSSIKLWLTNRKREHWKDRVEHRVGGSSGSGNDDAPIGVRDETKLELMSSILSLIRAKPDLPSSKAK